MNINQLETPAFLLDLDVLERNIARYQKAAREKGKQLWPMTKTHKSTEIAKMQLEAGCEGFLAGSLDECEQLGNLGAAEIMYAYPVANEANIDRILRISRQCHLILRLDSFEAARLINRKAAAQNKSLDYVIIVDSGFHRFGIPPANVGDFARALSGLNNLRLRGISTHPGAVYGASGSEDLPGYVQQEAAAMLLAKNALAVAGFAIDLCTSGSTPTFFASLDTDHIQIQHPGNYVFHDYSQVMLRAASLEDCALSVQATIISHPRGSTYIMDAGAKHLALDQGGHGNNSVAGYGYVMGHPEVTVASLSEEVGKLTCDYSSLQVGDVVRIIPNHSCPVANLGGRLIGHRNGVVEREIHVDIKRDALRG